MLGAELKKAEVGWEGKGTEESLEPRSRTDGPSSV